MKGRTRHQALVSLVVGSVALYAAALPATAGASEGGRQHRDAQTSTRAAPRPRLCDAVDHVDRLTVTRTDAFPQNGFTFTFPAKVTVRSRSTAMGVARAICALRAVPRGEVFHCPIDFGIVYHLDFHLKGGGSAQHVTVDATGCRFVTGAGPGKEARFTTRPFWAALGRAMGLPHPGNATFRGSRRGS